MQGQADLVPPLVVQVHVARGVDGVQVEGRLGRRQRLAKTRNLIQPV